MAPKWVVWLTLFAVWLLVELYLAWAQSTDKNSDFPIAWIFLMTWTAGGCVVLGLAALIMWLV